METVQSIVEILVQILNIDINLLKDNKGLTPYTLSIQRLQKIKLFEKSNSSGGGGGSGSGIGFSSTTNGDGVINVNGGDEDDEIIGEKKIKFERIKEYLQLFEKKRKKSLQIFMK